MEEAKFAMSTKNEELRVKSQNLEKLFKLHKKLGETLIEFKIDLIQRLL